MIVLEECPRCGMVETDVGPAEVSAFKTRRAKLLAAGIRPASLRWHQCPREDFDPVKLRPRWLAFVLRVLGC